MRSKINDALKLRKKSDVLVQTMQISRIEQPLVFITTENLNVQELIEYRKPWESLFAFDKIKMNKKSHEAIVHDIEIEAFKSSNKMQQLQKEIKQWKSIKLIRKLMWLTKHENRINKSYSSIKISFLSKIELKNAIEKDMIIADTNGKTVEFISTKFETQCNKCQKFEHITNTCNALGWQTRPTCGWQTRPTCTWCRLRTCSI